ISARACANACGIRPAEDSGDSRGRVPRARPTRWRLSIVLEVVVVADALRGRRTLQELRRVPGLAGLPGSTFGGIAADLRLQLDDVHEYIRLPAQLVGNHRRLGGHGGNHGDPHAAALHRFDQGPEVAVAGEQHHVVDRPGDFHGVHGELDIHVALDLAPAGLVDELLGRLGHDGVAVVVEPVDQRANRGIFLILDHCGVIERAQQISARLEFAQQPLVVDVEAQGLGGRVKIGAVDEQRDLLLRRGHAGSLVIKTNSVGVPPRVTGGPIAVGLRERPQPCANCKAVERNPCARSGKNSGPIGTASRGLPNRGGAWRQDKFRPCALSSPSLANGRFSEGLDGRGVTRPWPVSPWKIVSTRSRTVSISCCWPAIERAWSPRARRSRWIATTTKTRSWPCAKSPTRRSPPAISRKISSTRSRSTSRWTSRSPRPCRSSAVPARGSMPMTPRLRRTA